MSQLNIRVLRTILAVQLPYYGIFEHVGNIILYMSKQELFEKIFKEHLKVESYSKSIDSLFSPRSKSKIDHKPYYQRNYVWDDHKASYFIESILLGTEIPPIVFFNNNSGVEVIDGRQRYETIMRFMKNEFSLTGKGLTHLLQLKGASWDSLNKKENEIIESFLDSKLRIIEFRLVNQPPLDLNLQDQVKKEIFSRYNSGITPLKKAEIDNAIYNEDHLTNFFKTKYQNNTALLNTVYQNFFKQLKNTPEKLPIEKILSFTRRSLVLPLYPINYFVRSTGRTNTLAKLYEFYSELKEGNAEEVLADFTAKVEFLSTIKGYSQQNELASNRLSLECFMWGYNILTAENCAFNLDNDEAMRAAEFIDENIDYFTLVDSNFSQEIMARFLSTAEYFRSNFKINLSPYITATDQKRGELKELSKPVESNAKLSELESLRLSKPEPANNSIDDIVRVMTRRRFLIRPSYQRQEVINIKKASSIIESILLGIKLPPIFVYKRKDGTNEIIDGQQRLLTLLGFLGEDYLNEQSKLVKSKNHKFKLQKLRVLKELNGFQFDQLDEDLKDKIYDFQIYVVEIDETQNPMFDPVDLFIRLNDKPYPIRENSFEMWNSWADVEIINAIKELKTSVYDWFYIKQIKRAKDRDRMENEELLTSLCYIEYYANKIGGPSTIDIYQKTNRMNARISTKARISSLMQSLSESPELKPEFIQAVKQVKNNIKKIKYVLIDRDVKSVELISFLSSELNFVFNAGKNVKGFRRRIQDFYFLWNMVVPHNFEMVKHHRIEMKKDIMEVFEFIKSIPEEYQIDSKGYDMYNSMMQKLLMKYEKAKRKIKLSEVQKLELIKNQQNKSSLSDAPIFMGDDIEIDHVKPLAIGGSDSLDNLGVTHKDENRRKGVKE